MSDIVRVALLGGIALAVAALCFMYQSLRGQIDALRAEVACLRIERVMGKTLAPQEPPAAPQRLAVGLLTGTAIGAAAASGAAWLLLG
ncbi:hypothetical protein ACFVU3_08200 [Streptomyces sp. NPDC058052]|uniref:hypothetical protein n=1 Tax=Streptomyces sp. NPDC058052 TaxID=3346316 RepID=UPI0036E7EFE8